MAHRSVTRMGRKVGHLIAQDGTRYGDRIPGSDYFRDFCPCCETPMRVVKWRVTHGYPTACRDCDPPHVGVGNPHSRLNGLDADPDAYARAAG